MAGYRIDLGVVDPDQPGRYCLGIECDGASYHSARSARDRDRLRQAVLEDRGWTIHRIWSTDWFHNPARELQRAVEAIEQARITNPAQVVSPESGGGGVGSGGKHVSHSVTEVAEVPDELPEVSGAERESDSFAEEISSTSEHDQRARLDAIGDVPSKHWSELASWARSHGFTARERGLLHRVGQYLSGEGLEPLSAEEFTEAQRLYERARSLGFGQRRGTETTSDTPIPYRLRVPEKTEVTFCIPSRWLQKHGSLFLTGPQRIIILRGGREKFCTR